MDSFLLFLAEKGAFNNQIQITTKRLGAALSMSQQNASIRLKKLEDAGLIYRSEEGVILTEKGRKKLKRYYSRLKSLFQPKQFVFTGKVMRGTEEGKNYVSLPKYKAGIKKHLGFTPFPGTLNVEIDDSQIEERLALREHTPLVIEGFKHRGRSFGPAELYPCRVGGYEGALVFPYRSHHGLRILEILSPHNLAKKLSLSKGSKVKIEVIFQ